MTSFRTVFASLDDYVKGNLEIVNDDPGVKSSLMRSTATCGRLIRSSARTALAVPLTSTTGAGGAFLPFLPRTGFS